MAFISGSLFQEFISGEDGVHFREFISGGLGVYLRG